MDSEKTSSIEETVSFNKIHNTSKDYENYIKSMSLSIISSVVVYIMISTILSDLCYYYMVISYEFKSQSFLEVIISGLILGLIFNSLSNNKEDDTIYLLISSAVTYTLVVLYYGLTGGSMGTINYYIMSIVLIFLCSYVGSHILRGLFTSNSTYVKKHTANKSDKTSKKKYSTLTATGLTTIIGIFLSDLLQDSLNQIPEGIINYGYNWLIFIIIGLVVGFVYSSLTKENEINLRNIIIIAVLIGLLSTDTLFNYTISFIFIIALFGYISSYILRKYRKTS